MSIYSSTPLRLDASENGGASAMHQSVVDSMEYLNMLVPGSAESHILSAAQESNRAAKAQREASLIQSLKEEQLHPSWPVESMLFFGTQWKQDIPLQQQQPPPTDNTAISNSLLQQKDFTVPNVHHPDHVLFSSLPSTFHEGETDLTSSTLLQRRRSAKRINTWQDNCLPSDIVGDQQRQSQENSSMWFKEENDIVPWQTLPFEDSLQSILNDTTLSQSGVDSWSGFPALLSPSPLSLQAPFDYARQQQQQEAFYDNTDAPSVPDNSQGLSTINSSPSDLFMSFMNDNSISSRSRDSSTSSLQSKGQVDEDYEREKMLCQVTDYRRTGDDNGINEMSKWTDIGSVSGSLKSKSSINSPQKRQRASKGTYLKSSNQSTRKLVHIGGIPFSVGQSETPSNGTIDKDSDGMRHTCPHPNCGKDFSTSGHARRHCRIHTNMRPFVCPHRECFSTFTRRDNCVQHQKTVHRSRLPAY
jgi:hypothetical protein